MDTKKVHLKPAIECSKFTAIAWTPFSNLSIAVLSLINHFYVFKKRHLTQEQGQTVHKHHKSTKMMKQKVK